MPILALFLTFALVDDPFPLDGAWFKAKLTSKGLAVNSSNGAVEPFKYKDLVYLRFREFMPEGIPHSVVLYEYDMVRQSVGGGPWSIWSTGFAGLYGDEQQLLTEDLSWDFDPVIIEGEHVAAFKQKLDKDDGSLKSAKYKSLGGRLGEFAGSNGGPPIDFWTAHGGFRVSARTVKAEKLPFDPKELATSPSVLVEKETPPTPPAPPPPPGPLEGPLLDSWWRVKISTRGFSFNAADNEATEKVKTRSTVYMRLQDGLIEGPKTTTYAAIYWMKDEDGVWFDTGGGSSAVRVLGDGDAVIDDGHIRAVSSSEGVTVDVDVDMQLKLKLNDDDTIKSGRAKTMGRSGYVSVGHIPTDIHRKDYFGGAKASMKWVPEEKLPFDPTP